MKILSHFRLNALRVAFALALLIATISILLSSSGSSAAPGQTGHALALRAAMHPDVARHSLVGFLKSVQNTPGRYHYPRMVSTRAHSLATDGSVNNSVLISEAVQTYDVFNAPPSFQPGDGTLTPENRTPVWTGDERFIVFASNRAHAAAAGGADTVDDGTYHLWSVLAKGDDPLDTTATPSLHQITFSTGSEFFPALNPVNNRQNTQLAFVSTVANGVLSAGGVTNLYAVSGFNAQTSTINVDSLTSLTIRTDLATGIGDVERPTWSPDGQRIAFSALDTTITPASAQVHHIYFLYVTSEGGLNGTQPSPTNPPAKLTTGAADDTDPAWTGPGQADYIAFASTASSITNSNTAPATTSVTTGATPMRSIYLITGSGTSATRITNTGNTPTTDDSGPAWNYNPGDTGELTFSRGASITGNHDIYYAFVYSTGTIFPETTNNPASQLNTADNAGNTNQTTANHYDDIYPTFSPFVTIDSIAYASNRSVTYNDQTTGTPLEIAESLASPSTGANGQPSVAAGYTGILVSEFQNINPPTLIPYSSGEVVHVTDGVTNTPRRNGDITPGNPVKFTVRLSDRESGVDDGNVYIQIKDPDSMYDDSKGLEHKVFTKDNTDFLRNSDSFASTDINEDPFASSVLVSSATAFLYDGGLSGNANDPRNDENIDTSQFPYETGNATQKFTISTNPDVITNAELRGDVGGYDSGVNASIAVGRDNGGTNPATYMNSATPSMRVALSGGDPRSFSSFGQEYECQYVKAHYNSGGAIDTTAADYGTPYYLAGIDDQGAHIGGQRPSRAEWLQLTRAATQDGLGGTLYTATWTTPTSQSDYYLDVIAYDKASSFSSFGSVASSPGTPVSGANMRIYDNVWGFSTQAFSGANDILLVSDNALGQKFVGSTFGGTGLANIPPIFYGAESYFTALDINKLPNAIYRFVQETGKTPQYNGMNVTPDDSPLAQLVDLGTTGENDLQFSAFETNGNLVYNGLGVGSYYDNSSQEDTVDGLTVSKSQEYSIWRTLSRGPVTPAVYAAYEPSTENQPAVDDTAAQHVFPAATVNDAHRCILWVSPYTGDLPFNVVGSLADVNVQAQLRGFVNAGGRLFVSGQHIANDLTDDGSQPALNTTGSFLTDVFNAQFVPNTGGSQNLSAGGGLGARISGDAYFNANTTLGVLQDFFTNETAAGFKYETPNSAPLIVGNNYNEVVIGDTAQNPLWRNDGSLDQLGPAFSSFGFSGNAAESQIDIITAQNGATPDINIAGPGNAGQFTSGTGSGLIYRESFGANGGKVIFSSFGLEGLGIEYYKYTANSIDSYYARNQRPNILHNIVTFLRTGTFTGTIFAGSGASGGAGTTVSGATVYLLPNEGKTIPGSNADGTPVRQAYSAQTLSDGTYRIDGVEPGAYFVDAYRTGFARTQANAVYTVSGNGLESVSLDIVPVAPGSLSGKVVDQAGKGISGAQLEFVSTDGQSTAAGTTNPDGTYTITNVQAGTYNGTVTATGYQAPTAGTTPGATVSGIVVQSSTTTPNVNFALTLVPATLGGLVTDDFSGTSVNGATVTIKNTVTGLTAATFTTAATPTPAAGTTGDGNAVNYIESLQAGTYTVTVTPPAGYSNPQPATSTVTIASQTFTRLDFTLTSSTGQIGGLVVDESGTPVDGATVTVTNSAGATVGTFETNAADPDTAAPPVGDGRPANYFGTLPAGGPYTVTITAPSSTPQTITAVTIARHEFTRVNSNMGGLVSTLGALQGLITDAATGAPITGATIAINDSTGNPVAGSPFTSTAGTATDYGPITLTEGTYTVSVSAANHATVSVSVAVVHDQTTTKNVALPSSQGDLGGLVTDSLTRQPLPGATVTVSASTGAVVATVTSLNTVSSPAEPTGDSAAQNYSSHLIADGTYTVSAAATNHTTQIATVTVNGGVFTRQNFALVSTIGTVGGLVEDSFTGAPISGVTVTIANATTGVTAATFSTSATASAAPDGGKLNYTGTLMQGTYTVTITRRGYGTVASKTITVTPNVFTRADFTGTSGLPPGHVFNATGQFLFFSVPYDYASSGVGFDELFGVLNTGTFSPLVLNPTNANRSHVYVWDPTALDYATDPTPPADGLHLGQGYWVYLVKPTEANVAGTAATGTVDVPLKTGWNMIGVPSLSAISLSNVMFNNPSTNVNVTFAQATSTYKLISSPLYGYTTGGGYYQVAAGASLQPWQAYWIYAFSPTTIELPTGQ